MNIRIISAGAGSGKTYRLTSEMVDLLKSGLRAGGIIATTFTKKAAAELQERVRVRLLEAGMTEQADALTNALIGTVHGLGVKLLKRFAYEAGVSPEVDIIADEDQQVLFNQSLATVLTEERVERMEALCARFGLNDNDYFDWRNEVRQLTEVARANDFSEEVLERSKQQSFESFLPFLGEVADRSPEAFNEGLAALLGDTITRLENNEDGTKTTQTAVNKLKGLQRELRLRGWLSWPDWARIAKLKVGAKSRDDAEELIDFAARHDTNPAFHQNIRDFIYQLFDIAISAIREYDRYKKQRGLIDYTDMEVLVKQLLDQESVREVLSEELDLLMVDEFQDTSPIQLEIFLKLSRLAPHSIWVGDPKQSIYGFRGADPRLMQAVIEAVGGVAPDDIQTHSWRSREDIVYATNALFTKAFDFLPEEQVALQPKRTKTATEDSLNEDNEPIEVDDALMHWHFVYDGEGRRQPGKPWMENCIAEAIVQLLNGKKHILPKGEKEYRLARPGDIAVLCRSNNDCQAVAEALARAGLRTAISRAGLLDTAEATLILACLKYLLNRRDSLSIAEILLLGEGWRTEQIIEHRLDYLEPDQENNSREAWAFDQPLIRRLEELRDEVIELSSAEMLDQLLESLDLRRVIISWGNPQQRLDNVDVLRRFALQYEEACNRMHSAASLGGFLLWLGEQARREEDKQGSGEGPDAVNVLTYHRSKGLEWPIVVCHSLEKRLRSDIWGIEIVPETDEVDLDNVLGNRWLRYWVNPYDRQNKNTPVDNRLSESTAQTEKDEESRREEARLLYVGMTRARDYLILPSSGYPTRWLNRVWHGDENTPTLLPDTHESPWEWKDNFLDIYTETFAFPKDFPHADTVDGPISFLEARRGKEPHIPYLIDLREEKLNGEFEARPGANTQYASAIPMDEETDTYQAAKMLKAFLAGFRPAASTEQQAAMARGFLKRFELEEFIDLPDLLDYGRRFYGYLDQQYTIQQEYRHYPIRYFFKGRLFEPTLDLLLHTDRGLLLIQHSSFDGKDSKAKNKALELADFLFLSRRALQEVFGEVPVRTMVHFVLQSRLIEVETREVEGF